MSKIEVIGSSTCPFAQRIRLVLMEKNVDFTFYPHLQCFCALDYYRGFQIPKKCKLLRKWLTIMASNRFVRMMQISEVVLIRNWEKYALNTSTGATAEDMREAS